LLTRTLSILTLGAGLVLSAAACSDTGGTSAAGAPTATTAPAATIAAAAPTATAAPSATASAIAPTSQVCPVTAAKLLATMKADKAGASDLKRGATLGKPECYAGHVLVTETSVKGSNGKPLGDDEIAMFKFESGSWKYLGSATAEFCEGMPPLTRDHFERVFPSGCGGES
jgi:hypothetical protein